MTSDLHSNPCLTATAAARESGSLAVRLIAALLLFLLAESGALRAETFAIQDATGPDNNASSDGRTLGWIFNANQDLVVQRLGVWDDGADGLLASHQVGIWTGGGSLLGSTTVQSGTGSALDGPVVSGGQFRFEPVAAIPLSAGQTYVVGALFDGNDDFIFDATSVTVAPEISFDTERFSISGGGFVFPTDTVNRPGLFGPNFTYIVVPEPASLILIGSATLALAVLRRRF